MISNKIILRQIKTTVALTALIALATPAFAPNDGAARAPAQSSAAAQPAQTAPDPNLAYERGRIGDMMPAARFLEMPADVQKRLEGKYQNVKDPKTSLKQIETLLEEFKASF